MDNMSWFDTYRGPKRIIVEPGQATCWIGFSVEMGNGGIMRKDLYTYGPTLGQALAEARECMNLFQTDYQYRTFSMLLVPAAGTDIALPRLPLLRLNMRMITPKSKAD
jgi:hypothetical protein